MKTIAITGIGADVEVFVKDRKTDEIISAEGFIQGTKEKPFVFDEERKDFATSLDNVLAEFGIPPATNKVEFYNYLRKSLKFIDDTLPEHLCTAIQPAAELDERWLRTLQSRKFGCEPDYNAYTLNVNERPLSFNRNLRSAGGHLHVGYVDPFFISNNNGAYVGDRERSTIVKVLDLYLGVPSVLLEPDNKRKELYGKAGAYRPKVYGLEYRTISNFYLKSKELVYWVYQAVVNAVNWLNEGHVIDNNFAARIQAVINDNNKYEAKELISSMNLLSPALMKRCGI